jgi:hypothetical protein
MGLMCFFKDHNWERTEMWTGTAYDIIRIEVEQFKCSRCGKTKKSVRVFGKLSKKVAEDIVDNSTGVVNDRYVKEETTLPESFTLTNTKEDECKTAA